MTQVKVIAMLLISVGIAGCVGKGEVRASCDKPRPYQTAQTADRVAAPEGLDQLDGLKEMPIPESRSPEVPEGAGRSD